MSAPAPDGAEAIASSDVVLDVSLSTAWHDTLALARSHHLTNDDAAYLELALRRGLPLASRRQGPPGGGPAGGSAPAALLKPGHR